MDTSQTTLKGSTLDVVRVTELQERLPPFKQPSSFGQWLGAWFAGAILLVMTILSALIWLCWWRSLPMIADAHSVLGPSASAKEVLECFKTLRTNHFNEYRALFDLLIPSFFLSLFTLLAGYAFGSKQINR